MAVALLIKNIHQTETTIEGSSYKFYQSKLRQLMTETRRRKEQDLRQKQSKDIRISEQRIHREYMKYIRDKTKQQSQEEKPTEARKRPMTLSVSSTNISPIMESRTKSILKTRLTPTPLKFPQLNRLVKTITPEIDDTLSKANIHSFTQASSSSLTSLNHRQARQSILATIALHLDSHIPANTLKQPAYLDITQKFSSSIAPSVYRNFQRTVF